MEAPITIRDTQVRQLQELNLMSMERLDRSSPELWPEHVPGLESYPVKTSGPPKTAAWMGEYDDGDYNLLLALSRNSAGGLVQEVKKLYDAAYRLGCEESKEVTRGKYLQILLKPNKQD